MVPRGVAKRGEYKSGVKLQAQRLCCTRICVVHVDFSFQALVLFLSTLESYFVSFLRELLFMFDAVRC